jgi:basic membrane protein A and related proteins
MRARWVSSVVAVLMVVGIMICGSWSEAADEAAPKSVRIAVVNSLIKELPWNTGLVQALDRVVKEKPFGLKVDWDFVENVSNADAQRVMNELAKTGKYDIIWGHDPYPEAAKVLSKKYPDILWVIAGAGNEGIGGNVYWVDIFLHEAGYLCGIIAGMMSESNVVSSVASYPYPSVNLPVNGFFDGAKSVNPEIKGKVTYIEAWLDPMKAKESALAQIAAGSDFVYAERFGPFEACKEKGVPAFGHMVDQFDILPEVVVSSTLYLWDPVIKSVIADWLAFKTDGKAYSAPKERIIFTMKDKATGIAPYHEWDIKIPQKVKDAVIKAQGDIATGKLKVPMREEKAVSD